MTITSTLLFDRPQREIASLIADRIDASSSTSIVTGFATPGGLATIAEPIRSRPSMLKTLVVGAATYQGFETLDELLTAHVDPSRLYVHLGHTFRTGGKSNPFARYRPMLHSKIYYMELPGSHACAFIGSHNVTSYALSGLNGEVAVMLQGPVASAEFTKVRNHIEVARAQAVRYSSAMKEAYTWWMREFVDGLRVELGLPHDWVSVRTILLFANAAQIHRPKTGELLYFEIPEGIGQIENLRTETHLFLFNKLPDSPQLALERAHLADAKYTCTTLGADNKQGNMEVKADWRLDGASRLDLKKVPSGKFRPRTQHGKQQVRAEVVAPGVKHYEYLFERETTGWDPVFAADRPLLPDWRRFQEGDAPALLDFTTGKQGRPKDELVILNEAYGKDRTRRGWSRVIDLARREGAIKERDAAALKFARPESGAFVLVSLRRREKKKPETDR